MSESVNNQQAPSVPPTTAPSGVIPPSVVVFTRNDEVEVAACLAGLSWAQEVVVVDAGSTDRTRAIAAGFANVRVVACDAADEAAQRNFALTSVTYRSPWVYICGVNEVVTPELRQEILREITRPDQSAVAFRVRFKVVFFGRWVRHSSGYPTWLVRLVRPGKVRFEPDRRNPVVDGKLGSLDSHFEHSSFRTGLRRWFGKHNVYSDQMALEAARMRALPRPGLGELFTGEVASRRRAGRNYSFRMRFRGPLRWLYDNVVRLGFLDGVIGLRYSTLISMYEYWVELKTVEHERNWQQRNERKVRRLLNQNIDTGENLATVKPFPTGPGGEPLIEFMIPTLNEASHISETVRNVAQVGPVFVLDSFSTDGTQELARKAGATVVEHKFENYSKQKNWGIDNLPFKGKWIFIIDADERLTPELIEELRALVSNPTAANGYFVNRVVIMMGREIRHSGAFPSWNLRLFQRGTCRYEDRSVHEHMICDGPTGYLRDLMLHIRRESINEYLTKHIKYADMESDEWVKMVTGSDRAARAGKLFRDLLKYRLLLRRDIWPRIPAKPWVRFIYMYFFKLGFLDGRAGWHLASLMSCYEYMIELLFLEKVHNARQAGNSSSSASSNSKPS